MKKIMYTLFALLTMTVAANAMSYEQARSEALFLTDKMAYELNLSDAQYEAAYEINLDYLMGVTSRHDVFGTYWERRNHDLSYVLFSWQWDLFRAATYFYRPLYWEAGYWHFGIYARYPHRDYFYFGRPHFYATYRGGHSWRQNGGRSYYEHHHDYYRPVGHDRNNHFGMRNSWDRGDYRGGRVGNGSSTRHTQHGDQNGNSRFSRSGSSSGTAQPGSHTSGTFGGTRQHSSTSTDQGTRTQPQPSVGSGSRRTTTATPSGSAGSFGGSRSGSSFGGSRSSSSAGSTRGSSAGGSTSVSSRGSGSPAGGSSAGSSRGGSFGGSRR